MDWDYIKRKVHMSMPGYTSDALICFKHDLRKRNDQPHRHAVSIFGATPLVVGRHLCCFVVVVVVPGFSSPKGSSSFFPVVSSPKGSSLSFDRTLEGWALSLLLSPGFRPPREALLLSPGFVPQGKLFVVRPHP